MVAIKKEPQSGSKAPIYLAPLKAI